MSDQAGQQTAGRPTVETVFTGEHEQVLRGSSTGPAHMPEHYCTHEAVVTVIDGSVEIRLSGTGDIQRVASGECYVIPAGEKHTLHAREAFSLFLVMPASAEIHFG
jgi:quercetin dioxygenase-like cupin family protein